MIEEPIADNLDTYLRPRAPSRGRRLRQALIVLVVALGIVVLARPAFQAALQGPPQLTVQFLSNISWGTITVVGNDTHATGTPPFTMRLTKRASGYHLGVTFTAPPFPEQTCRLFIPPLSHDAIGCEFAAQSATSRLVPDHYQVIFTQSIAELPDDQAAQIQTLADAQISAFNADTPIPSGGQYTVGDAYAHRVYVAQSALTAHLITERNDSAASACLTLFCVGTPFMQPVHGMAFHVTLTTLQRWEYVDATTGEYIGGNVESLTPLIIGLTLQFDHDQWQVAARDSLTQSPLCRDAQNDVSNFYFQSGATELDTPLHLVDKGAAGCVIQGQVYPRGTPAAKSPAIFLWRCGELFTVTDAAAQFAPILPRANATDLAVVGIG